MRRIYISAIIVLALTGCFGGKTAEAGPEETLKVFCEAVFSGDFEKAETMCDSLLIEDYLGKIRSFWNEADSAAMTIVPAILTETEIKITDVIKNGQERIVCYELTATDGTNRKKTATLRKEEGGWKISAITGRH